MSLQQQCLPLPRRRKRQGGNRSNKKGGNYQSNNIHDDSDDDNDNVHIPTQISDLNEMDATTYLASVSAQASQLPFVFVADGSNDGSNATSRNSYSTNNRNPKRNQQNEASWQGSATSVQYLYSNRLKIRPPPSIYHIPPIVRNRTQSMEEYTNTITHDFSNLRLFLHNSLNSPSVAKINCDDQNENQMDEDNDDDEDDDLGSIFQSKEKIKNSSDDRKIPVPPSKDCYNWHIFCVGKQEACGNVGGYYDVSDDEQDEEMENAPTATSTTSFDVRNVPPNGYEPTTSLLCQFDQIIIRRVISHHLHYLSQGHSMTKQRGKWIYSLLARLEKPLHRDEASCLTSLLRELCRIRSELSEEELKGDDIHDVVASTAAIATASAVHTTERMEDEGEAGQNASDVVVEVVKGMDSNYITLPKDTLAILNTLIVIIGIYFEQCSSLDAIMEVA